MENKDRRDATVAALDEMIRHADKGLSGFWVEDGEGCGNPAIFPEFAEGIKRGRLVQKTHDLCPWHTAVMYGGECDDLSCGCYYRCSIEKAGYLTAQERREVLIRFRTRLLQEDYDGSRKLEALLTKCERQRIQERILAQETEQQHHREILRQERLRKAAALMAKYPEYKELLENHYGENDVAHEEGGIVFFAPDSRSDVVGAEKLSYDAYLDIQLATLGHEYRSGFARGFFDPLFAFKGQIRRINASHICFERIFISGMSPDGEMFEDKEDHVWMDKAGFEGFAVGDCVSFGAEVYRYVKTGKGKRIDYGLRNPGVIRKIGAYQLPTDAEIMLQEIRHIICQSCFLSEQCSRQLCLMNPRRKKALEREVLAAIKSKSGEEKTK